jgi:hypothetical protein
MSPVNWACGKRNAKYRHGDSKSYLYQGIWQNMKRRCNNPNLEKAKYYIEKGITYDPKWHTYTNFKKDMWLKYQIAKMRFPNQKLSIERIDPNRNYNKANCTFIPCNQQNGNTSKNVPFIAINRVNGLIVESQNAREFARMAGVNNRKISHFLNGYTKKNKGNWAFIRVTI